MIQQSINSALYSAGFAKYAINKQLHYRMKEQQAIQSMQARKEQVKKHRVTTKKLIEFASNTPTSLGAKLGELPMEIQKQYVSENKKMLREQYRLKKGE